MCRGRCPGCDRTWALLCGIGRGAWRGGAGDRPGQALPRIGTSRRERFSSPFLDGRRREPAFPMVAAMLMKQRLPWSVASRAASGFLAHLGGGGRNDDWADPRPWRQKELGSSWTTSNGMAPRRDRQGHSASGRIRSFAAPLRPWRPRTVRLQRSAHRPMGSGRGPAGHPSGPVSTEEPVAMMPMMCRTRPRGKGDHAAVRTMTISMFC